MIPTRQVYRIKNQKNFWGYIGFLGMTPNTFINRHGNAYQLKGGKPLSCVICGRKSRFFSVTKIGRIYTHTDYYTIGVHCEPKCRYLIDEDVI